jgi:uncharacterized LabA/DUF88 family protein
MSISHGPGERVTTMRIRRREKSKHIGDEMCSLSFFAWNLIVGLILVVGLGKRDNKNCNSDWSTCSSSIVISSVSAFFYDTLPTSNTIRRLPSHESKYSILRANLFDNNEYDGQSNLQQQQQPTQQQPTFFSPTPAALTPLKVMLFVDGTWLYYSIYEREYERDVVAQRYGIDWKNEYVIDWSKIPTVACRALMEDRRYSWTSVPHALSSSSTGTTELTPVEIKRVSVYSSMRRDTGSDTFRYKMFSDLADYGFDVNMLEAGNKGQGEKCVDIQLAVDMLYYATVPDAYDVALLLTGDRDFLPAVVRCRQKGRRVGLISMRSAASQYFTETPNLLDYNTIWIEDYMDEWVREMTPEEKLKVRSNAHQQGRHQQMTSSGGISLYILRRVVADFIINSGEPSVSIRDIGRELKGVMLQQIKSTFGGLYQFFVVSDIFDIHGTSGKFFISLAGDQEQVEEKLQEERSRCVLSEEETALLKKYQHRERGARESVYEFTRKSRETKWADRMNLNNNITPTERMPKVDSDFEKMTVEQLKGRCRAAGLPVSGRKAQLIERLQSHTNENSAKVDRQPPYEESTQRLIRMVIEYLHAKGGRASSRDVGRYLAANSASESVRNDPGRIQQGGRMSALSEVKELFGTLNSFIKEIDPVEIDYDVHGPERSEGKEYDVILKS